MDTSKMDNGYKRAKEYNTVLYSEKFLLLGIQSIVFALYADASNDVGLDSTTFSIFETAHDAHAVPLMLYLMVEGWHVAHVLMYLGYRLFSSGPNDSGRISSLWTSAQPQTYENNFAQAAYLMQPVTHFLAALFVVLWWTDSWTVDDGFRWYTVAVLILTPFIIFSFSGFIIVYKIFFKSSASSKGSAASGSKAVFEAGMAGESFEF